MQKDTLCDFKVDCFDGSDEFNCSEYLPMHIAVDSRLFQ